MADFEVHLGLHCRTRPIGPARSNRVRGAETIMFEYDRAWLEDTDRFSLEPALALTRGAFAPSVAQTSLTVIWK
jgi:serine/threonine-protein kinase HipA